MNSFTTETRRTRSLISCTFLRALRASVVSSVVLLLIGAASGAPDYSEVDSIFSKHCLDCHEAKEPEGKLVLESFDTLMKGGESGATVVRGKSAESLLVKLIDGG